ncbi:MAG: CRTAC1 family protein [Caldilineaceae bacterium]|nr:CRTAC1 family protein [Caldilineaceae bacterium]
MRWFNRILLVSCLFAAFGLPSQAHAQGDDLAPVIAVSSRLAAPAACTDRFVPHTLDHVTTTDDGVVRMFEANGAGLAVGDLDNDGDPDLVLGGEAQPNSILWNRGDLTFDTARLGDGHARAVTIVDVDDDGRRDIVLTTNTGAVNYWRNQGDRTFARAFLPNVSHPAYVLGWRDLDGDGDLDLVTAPYDAGFLTDRGSEYRLDGSGVYVYENRGDRFVPTRLTGEAQALALAFEDLNGDHRPDILVGNDFGVPDFAFVQTDDGWVQAEPFVATTHSTMSIDLGDINNDGKPELFASDMKPYADDPALMAAYGPLMEGMSEEMHMEGDPQIMENVLQFAAPHGFVNQAPGWGVDGTGWSWSAKFGDLDQDGLLDLYVVNGMAEETMFAHLPNHELVEENQVLRNTGDGFVAMPAWGLNATAGGRAMSMADFDGDGDLDIVVNNLRAPAVLYENQLCGGDALVVQLAQPGVQNRDAIGARLGLLTDKGLYTRDVRAGSGYISGDPTQVHFGLPADATLIHLEILWPDGAISLVENPQADTLLRVERQ